MWFANGHCKIVANIQTFIFNASLLVFMRPLLIQSPPTSGRASFMRHICSSFYESTIANQDQVGCFQSLHIGSSFSAVVLHQVACIVFSYGMYDDTG